VATKQLLETLTRWSRGAASEDDVSDVYVRLGYEFNIACRAFGAIGVDTSDLGPVPDLLRTILEETLSQEASQASLDRYLPRIRDIIVNLLHGLKRKQQRLRQKNGNVSNSSTVSGTRQGSITSNHSAGAEDNPSRQSSKTLPGTRHGSTEMTGQGTNGVPPRMSSVAPRSASPNMLHSAATNMNVRKMNSFDYEVPNYEPSTSDSSLSGHTLHDTPVRAPYPEADIIPGPYEASRPSPSADFTLPRAVPKQQDALAALQRGGELERRASRRFSAYQIQKHFGTSSSGIPMMPPAQNSPIPNRGRDARESMNAVRVRGSLLQNRDRNRNQVVKDSSPAGRPRDRISEEGSMSAEIPSFEASSELAPLDSPNVKTPEDKLRPSYFGPGRIDNTIANSNNNFEGGEHVAAAATQSSAAESGFIHRQHVVVPTRRSSKKYVTTPDQTADPFQPQRPSSNGELALFLQYKTRIKKFVLVGGYEELSIARLQLAFIEKFAWNTHSTGMDLPEIYIQDPVSGVRHELEDLNDIKSRSVLVLNVDPVDEVKQHMDSELGSLRRVIEGVRSALDDQQSVLQRVSDKQQDAAQEMARIAVSPLPVRVPSVSKTNALLGALKGTNNQVVELQGLRRDLAVMRKIYSSFVSGIEDSMSNIRAKAVTVKSAAMEASIPSFDGESGRSYVNAGKKSLSDDSEQIINRVDDLQDVVEDLRKDVVARGVRPLPQQLEAVSKEISMATSELKKLQEYIRREKPTWTKIWKNELQVVCDDQNLLTMQEELAADLEDDLEKAAQTFALVEQATKQQNLHSVPGISSRSSSRNLNTTVPDVDPQKAKDGVLGEVRALQPNHETRLEAIERAEKARQRELESRDKGEFKMELGIFVDGGKLKKSGGVEEAERLRKFKDDIIRKEVWSRQNGTVPNQEQEASTTARHRDEPAQLEIPYRTETGGSTSPEPEFVEAVEQPLANGNGTHRM